jgi:pyridoxine 4-dehydrogenase
MGNLFLKSIYETIDIGGIKVNRIGIGTNRITDSDTAHKLLKYAVASGVNFIDTAHVYSGGDSETTIGKILSPYPENLIVATKGGMGEGGKGNNSEGFLKSNLETSLKRLKTDRVDLYQIHRPDPNVPIKDTMELLNSFQDEGKIKHIGWSEVSLEQLKEAMTYGEVVSVQNQFSLTFREHEAVLEFCSKNNIVFIPWFPLRDINDNPELAHRLDSYVKKYGYSAQQIILAWMLKKSPMMLPIPGTLSTEHLAGNIASGYIELSDKDFKAIDSIKS